MGEHFIKETKKKFKNLFLIEFLGFIGFLGLNE